MRSPIRPAFRFLALGASLGALMPIAALADSSAPRVPAASVLVPIVVKAAEYDRHFAARANGRVRTLVLFRAGDAASERSAREVVAMLAITGKIAGLAHDERGQAFGGANALAAQIRAEQTAVVIVATGLESEIPSIAHELDGIDVLSVAVDPDDVPKGVVFGVDARGGKPTLVIRLNQAAHQNVAFEASLLKLARIE